MVDEQYTAYLNSIDKTQLETKAHITQYHQQLKGLDNQLKELKKF